MNKIENESYEIKLMTFNILFDNPLDILSKSSHSWNDRKEHVISVLKKYECDIICLQECLFTQLNYIKNKLPMYDYYGAKSQTVHWTDMNPIFFKKEKFELLQQGTSWYSDTPDIQGSKSYGNWVPRTFSWVLLRNKFSSEDIFIVNTHLDVLSEDSRQMGMIQLTEFMKNLKYSYQLIFLAGDFNSLYDNDIFNLIKDESLSMNDSVVLASDYMKTVGTYHNFGDNNNNYRIDYIFYGNKKGIVLNGSYEVIQESPINGKFASDHHPVVIKFIINNKAYD
jgi:endonuclease/exonuclease/phosphatase family metal-dependent hydrolase